MRIEHGTWASNYPDAIVVTKADGEVTYWNPAAESMFGFASAEVVGRNLGDLVVPPDEQARHLRSLADGLSGQSIAYECLRLRKDRSLICVDVSARRLDESPSPSPLILFSKRDATRRVAQADARLMESRFRDLLESMPDAVVIVNQTGAIVITNRTADQLFGYEPGELIGREVELLLPGGLRAAHLAHRARFSVAPRRRAMGSGRDLSGRRKDGSELPIEVSLSPLSMEDRPFVMSAIRDATERQAFEGRLHAQNIALARAVKARDDFFASMSHELRTPLNAIIGFTGTLLLQLAGPLNEHQTKQLSTVQSSARHLLAVINDLLQIATLDERKEGLRGTTTDLAAAAREAVATLADEAARKTLALTGPGDGVSCPVRGDDRAVRQILLNLVGNAVKFTREGSVQVTLAAPRGDGTAAVVITDTGPGIGADMRGRLFAAFGRGAGSVEGTGLGLHISRKLAHAMDGDIEYDSVPGLGSRFVLTMREA